jgi:hypothetical protein
MLPARLATKQPLWQRRPSPPHPPAAVLALISEVEEVIGTQEAAAAAAARASLGGALLRGGLVRGPGAAPATAWVNSGRVHRSACLLGANWRWCVNRHGPALCLGAAHLLGCSLAALPPPRGRRCCARCAPLLPGSPVSACAASLPPALVLLPGRPPPRPPARPPPWPSWGGQRWPTGLMRGAADA